MYNIEESGKRIKKMRMNIGKTQAEVANELSISLETVSKIERGNRGMSIDLLSDYSKYFGVSMDYIVNGIEKTGEASDISEINRLLRNVPKKYEEVVKKMVIGMLSQLEV